MHLPTRVFATVACLGLSLAAVASSRAETEPDLRKLEKEIAAVRELAFKTPVAVKQVPRPKETGADVPGVYSPADKVLLLYRPLAEWDRADIVREMAIALLDQHFDLTKLRKKPSGPDGELALAALVEGDATLTTAKVLGKDHPAAAWLTVPLAGAKDMQRTFLRGQGSRYVQAVHGRGGWKSVGNAYRFLPSSTAAILHPEGASFIDLGPGLIRGEFGLIRMLAGHPDTAGRAVQAAGGWQGDRFSEDGPRSTWVVAFDRPANAFQFHAALIRLRAAQRADWQTVPARPGEERWQSPTGALAAVILRGDRVLELEAPDDASFRELRDAAEGPPPMQIYQAKNGQALTFGALIDQLLDADLVCIGEAHDSDLNHRVQYQIIKALYARDERLGVGLEMFQQPYQEFLDRYVRQDMPEDEMLRTTEYQQRWGYPWPLYRPIVQFCRRNGVPIGALNAPRELTRRLSQVGFEKLTADEKLQLGEVDFQVREHRDHWYERLAQMHGQTNVPAEQKERSYQVMTTWDGYMGARAGDFLRARGLRRLVVLAGSGHIDRGFGIPARAAKRSGGRAVTIKVEVGGDPAQVLREPVTDFVVIVK